MDIDWKFVKDHAKDDPLKLRLKFQSGISLDNNIVKQSISDSILQIECRKKYYKKLASLLEDSPEFLFPSLLSGEQATDFRVAELHADIAEELLKDGCKSVNDASYKLIDMTCGLGIDFIIISKRISSDGHKTLAIEIDKQKADILKSNLLTVGLPEAEVINEDSVEYLLKLNNNSVSILFADPARRGEGSKRIYNPTDCNPDITGYWDSLLNKADWILVKNSPMLDINKIPDLFPGTVKIIITSVKNECKEVLVIARENGEFEGIHCYNLADEKLDKKEAKNGIFLRPSDLLKELSSFSFATIADVKNGAYLYEPNSSVMKVKPWIYLATKFRPVKKLSPNCHIFISDEKIDNFPGRRVKIEDIPDKKTRKSLKGAKINVVTRNYPISAEELSDSLHIKPGGQKFLYGLTVGAEEKPVLIISDPI